jgi:phage anti-repressor protein
MKLNLHLQKNDLVPVYVTDLGNQVVNARELHEFLGIDDKFNTWIKRKIKAHNFSEANKDFTTYTEKTAKVLKRESAKKETRGRAPKEYILRLNVAKKIAMGTNNEAGDRVKDYFLECERIAKGGSQQQPKINIGDHTKREVQVENSKASAAITFQQEGLEGTKEYFKKTCLIASGMTTTEVRNIGIRNGLKTKDTNSARACLRKINPPAAATLSFIDTAYRAGVPLEKVKTLASKVKDVFNDMLNLGLTPGELEG